MGMTHMYLSEADRCLGGLMPVGACLHKQPQKTHFDMDTETIHTHTMEERRRGGSLTHILGPNVERCEPTGAEEQGGCWPITSHCSSASGPPGALGDSLNPLPVTKDGFEL